jgi:hypothetical protein
MDGKGLNVLKRMVLPAIALATMLLGPVQAAVAAPATPVAAEQCTVEPRTPGAISEIVTEEDLANSVPFDDAVEYVKPEGDPADEATVAAVTETVTQLIACTNAGDFLRFLATFSDDGLRRHGADLGLPIADDDPILTPEPTADDFLALGAIEDTIVMTDGRVSALVTLIYDGEVPGERAQLIFSKQEDRWLIDQLQPVTSLDASWTKVSGDGYEGVIVDADTGADFGRYISGADVQAGWVPTVDQIATVEAGLATFLKESPIAAPDLWQRLPGYKRQYGGYINADGQSIIVVNAFCHWSDDTWLSTAVIVMDGGDCFFNVEYNVDLAAFDSLIINGEA